MLSFKMFLEELDYEAATAIVMNALGLDPKDAESKSQKLSLFEKRGSILKMPIIAALPNFNNISNIVNNQANRYTVGMLCNELVNGSKAVK